jgi:hypothetical protein
MGVLEKVRTTLGQYADTDIRELLHVDHERIRDLARELAETESVMRRKVLLHELRLLLRTHSRSEEAAVYAPLMALHNSPDSRVAGNEGMIEHNLAEIVLDRLANTSAHSSDMWKAHAKILHESLEHHIRQEERAVFEELGEHFSDAEREIMAGLFRLGKEKLLRPVVVRAGRKASRTRSMPATA